MKLTHTLAAISLIATIATPAVANAAPMSGSTVAGSVTADREYGPGNRGVTLADREYGPGPNNVTPADREYGPDPNGVTPADREYGSGAENERRNGMDGGKSARDRWCARKFDEAQRIDMESFRDFDAEAWEHGHADNAVSIYPSGARFAGIDAIMAAQEGHFTRREAVWSWEEVNRQVIGCSSGFIEYVAVYEIPRTGYYQRAHTIVSYVWTKDGWKSVLDQGTMLEVRSG